MKEKVVKGKKMGNDEMVEGESSEGEDELDDVVEGGSSGGEDG